MANNVAVTPGSGANITTTEMTDGSQAQGIKLLAGGTTKAEVPADATYGIACDIKRIVGQTYMEVRQATGTNLKVDASGVAVPVTDNSGSLTVDAPVGTPVFVRLSSGSVAVDTLPVSGTVTANQGTAAAVASGWPVKITDGTDTVGISTVGGAMAIKVDVIQTVGAAGSQADQTAFTAGTSTFAPVGGVYNDSVADATSGNMAAARLTIKRALHANLRTAAGVELGTSASPIYVSPAGTPNNQPVTQAVANWTIDVNKVAGASIATAASGIPKVGLTDATGAAFSSTNPLTVITKAGGETRITTSASLSASQTAASIVTPTSGKKFRVRKIILAVSVAGTLTLFDGTNASANILADGTMPTGVQQFNFDPPFDSAIANNILKYTSGTGLTAVITVHGYEE